MRESVSVSLSSAIACRSSTKAPAALCARRCMTRLVMADISLRKVTKRFKTVTALDDLSLDIADGAFTVLLGPTGAGKTTTLRIVAGLEKPDSGEVWIDGHNAQSLEPAARDVTFVFQQYSLYPHLSVFDNLAFPLRSPARRVAEAEIRQRVEDIAGLLRIGHKLKNKST